ncbi:hypothetical protein KAJ27_16225 [bacterium]|nr:hypothetical protein [bacterium]
MKLFFTFLLICSILSVSIYSSELNSKYYSAEGMYYNGAYSEALKNYQTLLSLSDKSYANHEKILYRVISILKDSQNADDKDLVKMYCKKYLREYPAGNYSITVEKLVFDTDKVNVVKNAPEIPVQPYVKPVVIKKPELVKKTPVEKIKSPDISNTTLPTESLKGRFQNGFWVKYKLNNFLAAGSIKYDHLTYAISKASYSGNKLKCNLIAIYENSFEKLIMVYKVVFKDLQHYSIQDVTVKMSGRRQSTVDSNITGGQLPIGLLTLKDLKKICILTNKYNKIVNGKNIECYDFKYDSGNLNLASETIYSTQIPIMSCYYIKARNPNYTYYEFELVDFGYSGGERLAY